MPVSPEKLLWFFFFFFLAAPRGVWDLSSLIRDQTRCPLQWKHGVLTTGPPGKSLLFFVCLFLEKLL